MDQEQQAIFDCGAYANLTGFPRTDCPSGWEMWWLAGWEAAKNMGVSEREALKARKRCA